MQNVLPYNSMGSGLILCAIIVLQNRQVGQPPVHCPKLLMHSGPIIPTPAELLLDWCLALLINNRSRLLQILRIVSPSQVIIIHQSAFALE